MRYYFARYPQISETSRILPFTRTSKGDNLHLGSLTFYPDTRQVWLKDRLVSLSRQEFDLLKLLAAGQGQIFSRQELIQQLKNKEINERSIDAQIRRLRDKIESKGKPKYIEIIRGIGYRFRPR